MTAYGLEKGIHQHISPDVKIEYKTTEANRQFIPWVKYTNTKTGETYVYTDSENPVNQQQLDSLETRVMDCLDCHNRPSHDYQAPQNFIDKSLAEGRIPKSLPSIKMIAMLALNQEYPDKDSAFIAIRTQVYEYYELSDPDVLQSRKSEIEQAITQIQKDYANNIFPYMKANWKVYPNNIGHMESDGCFRCHNDRHKTSEGRLISKDCNLCHSILAQGQPDSLEYSRSLGSLVFAHPADIGDDWKTELCSSCHSSLY